MPLYHFTSRDHLPSILQTGLCRGSIATSPATRVHAIWLTSDPGGDGHGLGSGGDFLTDDQRRQALEWSGLLPPEGARFAKPADLRLTVDIGPGDGNLHAWLPWARRNLSSEWLARLHPVACANLHKAKSWWIYFGVIPPSALLAADPVEDPAQARPLLSTVS
jgi:hypothetical protein